MSAPMPMPDRLRVREVALDAAVRSTPWDEDGIDITRALAVAEQLEAWLTRPEAPHASCSPAAERDLDALAAVGRMYLDALDADPANEALTLPEAILVTDVRVAVERRERYREGFPC